MKYRLEVKVTGWVTREVEADSLEEAEDIAAELDWTMPLGDLRWKSAEVEATA
jgi:hypothetical protein